MKCPALLLDRETGNCSHSKLIALVTMVVILIVFALVNILGRSSITGWEGAITLAIAAMGNAQVSKYLSPSDKPKDGKPEGPQ